MRLRALKPQLKSPMALSLDMLRKHGYVCEIVEHRVHIPGQTQSRVTRDLLGFADILALKDFALLVQTTSVGNISARVNKIRALASFAHAKRAGFRVEVHGWGLGGVRVIDLTDEVIDWSTIVGAGRRSKNRPTTQTALDLFGSPK